SSKYNKIVFDRCQAECVETFKNLVSMRINRYKDFNNYKDLYQEGIIALISCLKTYDSSKGSFYWWAHKYIDTKIGREANKHSTINIPIAKIKNHNLKPFKIDDSNKKNDVDDVSTKYIDMVENFDQLEKALSKLTSQQKDIIVMFYGLGNFDPHSIASLSKKFSISKKNCLKLLNEAKQTLKNNLIL